jgi:outer membrane usher protein
VRWVVIAIAILALAGSADAADQRALLTLTVNTTSVGEVPVLLRDDELFVRVHDLEDTTRLRLPLGERIDFAGDTYIGLSSLAPEIRYTYSEENLRVDVTAPAALFLATTAQLAATRPEGFRISSDTSAYVNYAVERVDFGIPSAVVEAGVSLGGTVLFQTTASRSDRLPFARGLTSLQVEDHDRLTRLTLGDGVASSTTLGGGGVIGGITYRRDYTQDPYYIHRPDTVFTGLATTPSRAKIYVNGVLLRETRLPTGPYELHNLTIPSGARNVDIVVTDAFGRESRMTTASYVIPALIKPGEHDYSVTVGLPRLNADPQHPFAQYGTPVVLAADRYGLTNQVTLGGRVEAGQSFVSFGPGVTVGSRFGQFDMETAFSVEQRPGVALAAAYSYSAIRYSFGVMGRVLSPQYTNASLRESMDRTTFEVQPYLSYQLMPNWGISVSAFHTRTRDHLSTNGLHAGTGVALARGIGILLNADYLSNNQGQTTWGATLTVNVALGGGNNARTVTTNGTHGPTTGVVIDKSLPMGDGFGYRINGTVGGGMSSAGGLLQYQGPYGRFEGDVSDELDQKTGGLRHRLHYAGGVSMVNGYMKVGRPVEDAFGIIKVADLENVRVKVENSVIGQTGSDGTLLLPTLLPYFGNQVEIVTEDIPVDRNIEVLKHLAVPPRRGGTFLDFRAPKVFGINGTIRPQIPDLPVSFGPGELTVMVHGKQIEAVVGRHGEFYLEDLTPGTYEAHAEFPNIACRATFTIPETTESFVAVGEVPCVRDERSF